jgi:hypothetical protein
MGLVVRENPAGPSPPGKPDVERVLKPGGCRLEISKAREFELLLCCAESPPADRR